MQELQTSVTTELSARIPHPKPEDLVLYTHDCKDSAKYHREKYKHWAKLVKSVDLTQTSGYAFIGDFLNIEREHKVPINSLIVEVCHYTIKGYVMAADKVIKFAEGNTGSMSSFIDDVAAKLKELNGGT